MGIFSHQLIAGQNNIQIGFKDAICPTAAEKFKRVYKRGHTRMSERAF